MALPLGLGECEFNTFGIHLHRLQIASAKDYAVPCGLQVIREGSIWSSIHFILLE